VEAASEEGRRGRMRIMRKSTALLCGLSLFVSTSVVSAATEKPDKVRVAEGEWLMRANVEGELIEIRESWTLWRGSGDSFQVESDVSMRYPPVERRNFRLSFTLDPQLHPTRFEILAGDLGEATSGPMVCEFGSRQFSCEVRGKRQTLEIEAPYDFYPAVSGWFWSSIVRRGKGMPGESFPAKWIFMDDVPDGIELDPAEARVRLLAEEDCSISGKTYKAQKFEVQLADSLTMHVWVLPEGVLFAYEDAGKPEQRMELVRYHTFNEFWPAGK
jgi:hypothetical protein